MVRKRVAVPLTRRWVWTAQKDCSDICNGNGNHDGKSKPPPHRQHLQPPDEIAEEEQERELDAENGYPCDGSTGSSYHATCRELVEKLW